MLLPFGLAVAHLMLAAVHERGATFQQHDPRGDSSGISQLEGLAGCRAETIRLGLHRLDEHRRVWTMGRVSQVRETIQHN
jgi:hypothetical protein